MGVCDFEQLWVLSSGGICYGDNTVDIQEVLN